MYARLVELANRQTSDEVDYYRSNYDDGKIILARAFLDETVITQPTNS